jgi:2-hydroxychromene-2-carboxylate isomerase
MPEQPEMLKPIDFYFDFRSPYSYLASTALPKLAEERGAARWSPIILSGSGS